MVIKFYVDRSSCSTMAEPSTVESHAGDADRKHADEREKIAKLFASAEKSSELLSALKTENRELKKENAHLKKRVAYLEAIAKKVPNIGASSEQNGSSRPSMSGYIHWICKLPGESGKPCGAVNNYFRPPSAQIKNDTPFRCKWYVGDVPGASTYANSEDLVDYFPDIQSKDNHDEATKGQESVIWHQSTDPIFTPPAIESYGGTVESVRQYVRNEIGRAHV